MDSATLIAGMPAVLACSGASPPPTPMLATQYRTRPYPTDPAVTAMLASAKAACVSQGHEDHAKAIWCYEQVLRVQDDFVEVFTHLRSRAFYTAWKRLEDIQIAYRTLSQHLTDQTGELGLPFVAKVTTQLQSLYPYQLFISPAFLKREERCSICQAVRRPRSDCGHELGGIYGGQACYNIVTEAELLEISFVTNPVQKYSVAFLGNGQFNYANVAYLESALASPWHDWRVAEERRKYILPQFQGVARNDLCPCGSGRKFKKCCAGGNQYTEMPHFQFSFEVVPPAGVPTHLVGGVVHATDDVPTRAPVPAPETTA